jgi:hypothetical protein
VGASKSPQFFQADSGLGSRVNKKRNQKGDKGRR